LLEAVVGFGGAEGLYNDNRISCRW